MSIIKLNNQAVKNATSFGSILNLGSMVFIKKLTASSSATLSFVDGSDGVVLDDTYKEYLFTFNNIHPQTDNAKLEFNLSTDGGSNYNVTKTTTHFFSYHSEDDNDTALGYSTGSDLAQSTANKIITNGIGNANDESASGTMSLFSPSSSIFVKHFMSDMHGMRNDVYAWRFMKAGYFNTTTALTRFQFKLNSGNIDSGTIKLYGIKDS